MKNGVSSGVTMRWTNTTGSKVLSGAAVILGGLIAIAYGDIEDGEEGVLCLEGVFNVKKKSGVEFAVGDKLFYHATDGLTKTQTDAPAGIAAAPAGSDAVLADVKLMANLNRVAATQAATDAADLAALKVDFNALLTKLKNAGLMAAS